LIPIIGKIINNVLVLVIGWVIISASL